MHITYIYIYMYTHIYIYIYWFICPKDHSFEKLEVSNESAKLGTKHTNLQLKQSLFFDIFSTRKITCP